MIGRAVKMSICLVLVSSVVSAGDEPQVEALARRYAQVCAELDAAFEKAPREGCERMRVSCRRIMADRLLDLIRRDAGNPTVARRYELECADFEMFLDYFPREIAAWSKNPRNPAVRPRVFNVRDFGAKGDGVASETAAFHASFKAARESGAASCIIEIPAGDYRFCEPDWPELPYVSRVSGATATKRHVYPANLEIQGLENCLIRGAGGDKTRFHFEVYDAFGINLRNTLGVTLAGVELSWRETPFIEGRIVANDLTNCTCDIAWNPRSLNPCGPRAPRMANLYATIYDGNGVYDKTTQLAYFTGEADDLGGGRYRLHFKSGMGMFAKASWARPTLPVGHIICIGDRNDKIECVVAPDSVSPTLEGVWVRNSRCGAFTMGSCYQPNLLSCRIFPKEGFAMSTCADGFFSPPGSFIAGCDFRGMGDDGCNPHAIGGFVCETGKKTVTHWAVSGSFTPGMVYNFIDVKSGEYVATLHAVSRTPTEYDGKDAQITEFREDIPPSIASFVSLGLPPFKSRVVRVSSLSELPERIPAVAFAPNAAGIGFVCKGNRFSSFRGNASMQIQCSNALIEDNVAENTGSGVKVSSLLNYREGPPPYNVLVRNNVIRNTLTGIKCRTYSLDEESPVSGMPMSDISIVSNRLENCAGEAFRLANIDGGEVRGNVLVGKGLVYDMKNCRNVEFSDNVRDGKPFDLTR